MGSGYDIGPFRLDTEAGVLTRGQTPTALGSRAVAVLGVLVEHPNEFVSKARIMDAAWPGVIVEESNLAVQIAAIRRVLTEAGGRRWIETLARRGYRFVGPVAERKDRGPGRADARQRSNLPSPLTSFIGRERELVEIKRLLPSTRLLTIVGVGGIGKTRLALQAAGEVVDAYRDGVWFVDLAPLVDPALVPGAVAQVFGLREVAGTPLTETLGNYLRRRQFLLILDNCEHLLRASSHLADALLQRAPALTIVATSREPLQVEGEQSYPLSSLALPDPEAGTEAAARSEAVRLFVERAQRHQPGFVLTPARSPIVAELCIHLDGIPLALELAAARIRSLPVEQIHARLDNRFRLLTSGSRVALPRHQTLRATLDWSHDLLAEDERSVLRRLAVFAGGFLLEAAAAVASDGAVDEHAVIDVLGQLVSRSLVIADTSGPVARYRLLETMRAYAKEKLAEAEETAVVARRHAQYFRERFGLAFDDWWSMPESTWRALYLPDVDNVRAALDWSIGESGDPVLGLALAGLSWPVWTTLSLWGEGSRRLEQAVARIDVRTPELEQARLWRALAVLLDGAPQRAVAALERAVALYRGLHETLELGDSLTRVGRVLAQMGRFDEAGLALTEARTLLERSRVPRALAFFHSNSGFLKMQTHELADARRHYHKAMSLYHEIGADTAERVTLDNLAEVSWAMGDLEATAATLRESAALLRESPTGRKDWLAYALGNLAGVLTEGGRVDEALAAAREGLPLLRDTGYAWIFIDHLALRAALANKLANAARLAGFAESALATRQASRQPNEARARKRLQVLLRERLALPELERLLAEGAKMSEDEACRLALEE